MINPPERVDVTDLVLADFKARRKLGRASYGEALTTHNQRNALQDAYEEALDLALYLRQELEERKDAEISRRLP